MKRKKTLHARSAVTGVAVATVPCSRNPLAVARGKRRNVNALWHRKTGAGYSLFVQYYLAQPAGVVVGCADNDDDDEKKPCCHDSELRVSQSANRPKEVQVKGLSRASKRRKKKQGKNVVVSSEHVASDPLIVSPVKSELSAVRQQQEDGPLLDALYSITSSKKILYPHQGSSQTPLHTFRLFLCSLSKPLPITFRIRQGLDNDSERGLREELAAFHDLVRPCSLLGNNNNNMIYQSTAAQQLSKSSLKEKSPELKRFLNDHSWDGTLARQELGSMLPVLLLQATANSIFSAGSPRVRVLDLCASPGSKTLQLAELIGPEGRVRANDISPDRLDSLQKAVSRSGVANVGVIKFSNLDATEYPIPTENKKYDVVVCDVPCSGDGTCRKDASILVNWSPKIANALHSTQCRILTRALECVKVGGVVCYSTCSLNPVENEAVVAAALATTTMVATKKSSASPLSFELLPLPPLNGLILRPGVVTWKVADYDYASSSQQVTEDDDDDKEDDDLSDTPILQWYASYSDAVAAGMEHAVTTLWPSSNQTARSSVPPPSLNSQPCPSSPPLVHCGRLWPQDQDSGGFFVAMIRRTA